MDRSDFLSQLATSCRDLRDFFQPEGRRWLTNIIATGFDSAQNVVADKPLKIDRIYELVCYFSLLSELASHVDLIHIAGTEPDGYRLPYAPGNKSSFSFFRFTVNGRTFDLCNGTGIGGPGEGDEHPDISLQQVDGPEASRDPGEVVAIWDAKHHKGELPKTDLLCFLAWCLFFKVVEHTGDDVLATLFPPAFKVSALITNAQRWTSYINPMLELGFSVVLNFTGQAAGSLPTPSYDEHIAFQAQKLEMA